MGRRIYVCGLLAFALACGGTQGALDAGADADSAVDARLDSSVPDGGTGDADADARADSSVVLPPVSSLAELFGAIEGLTVTESAGPSGYRKYDLVLMQPQDPSTPDGASFPQRAVFFVRDDEDPNAPLVLITNGYALEEGRELEELARLVDGHQLAVEYRYNGSSTPGDAAFEFLTVEAGAADLHRWVTEMKRYFRGAVVSTGRSRSGMVALEHRALYADDVDATVAYVTPDVDGPGDRRYAMDLRGLGSASCRSDLDALQRALLGPRRSGVQNLVENGFSPAPTFMRMGGGDRAYESIVENLAMSFWQAYGSPHTCASIPRGTEPNAVLAGFLNETVTINLASDRGQAYFTAYYILAARQVGFPALPREHIADLLNTGVGSLEEGTVPAGVTTTWDSSADARVDTWVGETAERIVFIHGELDAWGVRVHPTSPAREVVEYRVAGAGHYNVSIAALSASDRSELEALVRGWAGR